MKKLLKKLYQNIPFKTYTYIMPYWLYSMIEDGFTKVQTEDELKQKIREFIKTGDTSKMFQIVDKESRKVIQVFFNTKTNKWDTQFKLRK